MRAGVTIYDEVKNEKRKTCHTSSDDDPFNYSTSSYVPITAFSYLTDDIRNPIFLRLMKLFTRICFRQIKAE